MVEVVLEKVEMHYKVPEFDVLRRLLKIYNMLYQRKCNSTPLELAEMVNIELTEYVNELTLLVGWTGGGNKRIFEDCLKATPKQHYLVQHSAPFLYLTGSFHYSSTQRYESTNKISRRVAVAMNHTGNKTFFASLRLFRVFVIGLHHQRLKHDSDYQQAAAEAAAAERKRAFMARAAKRKDTIARRSAAAAPDNGDGDSDDDKEAVSDASDASDTMDVD
ncbi:hypothetical protein GQ42DRAFT_60848 [Ramicandelaber brevisporus]|nr:hypothetical protein GQ42DRAFT_60848 [Ramicandelaber brevisporus]